MEKDFSNTPVSDIAKMLYALARENAEQVVNTVNDHGDRDPRYESEERTQEFECMITAEICEIKMYIDASFTCPAASDVLENEICFYFRIEYKGTNPEQDDIFNAYKEALYYELQKIVGYDCELCVE